MKKFLFTLSLLMVGLGAWAQATSPADGVYVISGGNLEATNDGDRGNMAAGTGYANYPVLSDIGMSNYVGNSVEAIENGDNWYVFKQEEGDKYYIYNLGNDKFIANVGGNINFSDVPYAWSIIVNSTYNTYNSICDGSQYICFGCGRTASGRNIFLHSKSGDGGSLHRFSAVENGTTTFADQITEAKNKAKIVAISYTITDNAGNQYTGTYDGVVGSVPTFAGAYGYTLTEQNWSGNSLTAKINFPVPASSTTKSVPTMISSFHTDKTADLYYWFTPDGENIKVKKNYLPSVSELPKCLWLVYPEFNATNSSFSFKVKNFSEDKYIYSTSTADTNGQGNVLLSETATSFTIDQYCQFSNSSKYLSTYGTGDEYFLSTWGAHTGTKNRIINPQFEINIGETDYATLYSPIDVAVPDGIKAYAVISATSNNAYMQEMADIAAENGVILQGTAGESYTFVYSESISDWSGNKLEGSLNDTYVSESAYVLANGSNGVGFYTAELNKNEAGETGNTHFLNNANKAYLQKSNVPSAANAPFLRFSLFGDTETDIESIEGAENADAVVYDLAGRRVKGVQKGLYIVNGKVVIK